VYSGGQNLIVIAPENAESFSSHERVLEEASFPNPDSNTQSETLEVAEVSNVLDDLNSLFDLNLSNLFAFGHASILAPNKIGRVLLKPKNLLPIAPAPRESSVVRIESRNESLFFQSTANSGVKPAKGNNAHGRKGALRCSRCRERKTKVH